MAQIHVTAPSWTVLTAFLAGIELANDGVISIVQIVDETHATLEDADAFEDRELTLSITGGPNAATESAPRYTR